LELLFFPFLTFLGFQTKGNEGEDFCHNFFSPFSILSLFFFRPAQKPLKMPGTRRADHRKFETLRSARHLSPAKGRRV
jgi:hypothetical protein